MIRLKLITKRRACQVMYSFIVFYLRFGSAVVASAFRFLLVSFIGLFNRTKLPGAPVIGHV